MASTKIEVSEKVFDEHLKRFSQKESLTKFMNRIVEKYLDEIIVELNEKNFQMIKELSIKMNKPISEMLNLCLDAVKFEYQEIEKPVVPIKKTKSNIRIKGQNPFTNY